jgi:hypothetical protein
MSNVYQFDVDSAGKSEPRLFSAEVSNPGQLTHKITSNSKAGKRKSIAEHDAESNLNKKRFVWPESLHRDFISAVFDIGLKFAKTSDVKELLGPTGSSSSSSSKGGSKSSITYDQIRSQIAKLQLFREQRRASENSFHFDNGSVGESAEDHLAIPIQSHMEPVAATRMPPPPPSMPVISPAFSAAAILRAKSVVDKVESVALSVESQSEFMAQWQDSLRKQVKLYEQLTAKADQLKKHLQDFRRESYHPDLFDDSPMEAAAAMSGLKQLSDSTMAAGSRLTVMGMAAAASKQQQQLSVKPVALSGAVKSAYLKEEMNAYLTIRERTVGDGAVARSSSGVGDGTQPSDFMGYPYHDVDSIIHERELLLSTKDWLPLSEDIFSHGAIPAAAAVAHAGDPLVRAELYTIKNEVKMQMGLQMGLHRQLVNKRDAQLSLHSSSQLMSASGSIATADGGGTFDSPEYMLQNNNNRHRCDGGTDVHFSDRASPNTAYAGNGPLDSTVNATASSGVAEDNWDDLFAFLDEFGTNFPAL